MLGGVHEFRGGPTDQLLITEGIYGTMRHPQYASVMLGVFAAAFGANYVGPYILAVLTVPMLHLITLLEERELVDRFGSAYRTYQARVPRFLPNWRSRGWRASGHPLPTALQWR